MNVAPKQTSCNKIVSDVLGPHQLEIHLMKTYLIKPVCLSCTTA